MADNNIAQLLANAGQTNADFNFGKITEAYWQGLENAYKQRNRDVFQDPSLYDAQGNLDTAKAFTKALQAGGLPAAENIAKLQDAAYNQQLQRGGNQFRSDLAGGAPSLPPSTAPGPAATEPRAAPQPTVPLPAPPPPQRQSLPAPAPPQQQSIVPQPSSGTFDQFLTVQGVPPEQRGAEAQKIQAAMMQATGRPVDTNAPLNLADPIVRDVLARYALARRAQAQTPQAPPAAPIVPQPVQTVPIRPPTPVTAASSMDQSLGGVIPPTVLRLGGGTAQGALDYLARIESGLSIKEREAVKQMIAAIQEQLKFTNEQKNAAAAGRTVRETQDQPGEEKQQQAVLESTIKGIADSTTEAKQLRDNINAAHRTRALLDSRPGVVTGVFQKDRLMLMRIANLVGLPNADRIGTTEAFNSEIANSVLGLAQSMKGTISDKDVVFLRQINGSGDLNENSLRQMLDIAEKVARAKLQIHNAQLDEAAKAFPAIKQNQNYYRVQAPGEYRRPPTQLKEGDRIQNKDGTIDVVRGGKRVRETP